MFDNKFCSGGLAYFLGVGWFIQKIGFDGLSSFLFGETRTSCLHS